MLRTLVAANLVASGAHFAHNALFLDRYPGPTWIPGPGFVVVAWFVVASALLLGYRWYRRGKRRQALVALTAYCVSCFFVFGHYLYGAPGAFDVLTNALIVTEGVAGIVLFAYVVRHVRSEFGRSSAWPGS